MAIATINPATGETLETFEPLTDREVDERLARADETFRAYRRTSFADRRRWMARAAEILEGEKDALGRLMTTEMGKTLSARRRAARWRR